MNSITKCSPVFNAKTGIISYKWEDLAQENPLCPKCDKAMKYWYSRRRGVIISGQKYTFMAPRFKCPCGQTRTMRPYFIASRKQYSIFSIQDMLNSDAFHDRTVAAAYGSSFVMGLRRWAVALVKGERPGLRETSFPDERSVIRMLHQKYGNHWLTSIFQSISKSQTFVLPAPLSG